MALVGFLLVVLYFLAAVARQPVTPSGSAAARDAPPMLYGVMIDAGSTGSRIHVYRFVRGARGDLVLQHELFQQLKPGLSSYKDDPEAGARSLVPLLDAAVHAVPPAQVFFF